MKAKKSFLLKPKNQVCQAFIIREILSPKRVLKVCRGLIRKLYAKVNGFALLVDSDTVF